MPYDRPYDRIVRPGLLDPPPSDAAPAPPGWVSPQKPAGLGAIRWGAVAVGVVMSLALFNMLTMLGSAIGLSSFDAGRDPQGASVMGAIWAVLAALLSFSLGGFLAARSSREPGPKEGIWHGALVWAAAAPLLVFAMSVTTSLMHQAMGDPRLSMPTMGRGGRGQPIMVDDERTTERAQMMVHNAARAAWGSFGSMLIALGAATAGGAAGARSLRRSRERDPLVPGEQVSVYG